MTEPDEDVIEAANRKGESLLVEEFVRLVERTHDGRPGVPRDLLESYADALEEHGERPFDVAEFPATLDARLTDATTWAEPGALYELPNGNVSRYPSRWHDALGGETDLREHVRFLTTDADGFVEEVRRGGAGDGVPEQALLDVAAAVGRMDRREAKSRLERLREADELVEDADQHPNASVRLPERTAEGRDVGSE